MVLVALEHSRVDESQNYNEKMALRDRQELVKIPFTYEALFLRCFRQGSSWSREIFTYRQGGPTGVKNLQK